MLLMRRAGGVPGIPMDHEELGLWPGANQSAMGLISAAKSGQRDALQKLLNYRQCSNCTHVSHVDRADQGLCYHCGRMMSGPQPMKWLSVVTLMNVPNCYGSFPC